MNNRLPIFGIVLVFLIASCSSSPEKKMLSCTFPDAANTKAPGWVCDQPVEGWVMSAAGSSEKTGAGHDFMKQMAATSARVLLAQRLATHVTNMVKQYAETTGAASTETVDRVNTLVTKQITDQTLVGSRIIETRISPNGHLYVLVGMDDEALKSETMNALKTSMGNDEALWQMFRAKMGQDELAAAITLGR